MYQTLRYNCIHKYMNNNRLHMKLAILSLNIKLSKAHYSRIE